jgi:hypothetical protein
MWHRRNTGVTCRVLVGRPGRKRPLGRARLRWENNIKMDYVPEVEWWDVDLIDVAGVSDWFNCCECGNLGFP